MLRIGNFIWRFMLVIAAGCFFMAALTGTTAPVAVVLGILAVLVFAVAVVGPVGSGPPRRFKSTK